MKRLITSDLQLSDLKRDEYRHLFVEQRLTKLVEKYQPDQLLLLGDLTEQKDNHPASLVNRIVKQIYNLSQICPIKILRGNHEYISIDHPFFEFVEKFENVKWYNYPERSGNCYFLPHTRNYKEDWKDLDFAGIKYVFTHNIFTGVCAANGHALSGIPPSIFPDGIRVFSGDVHEPQTFGNITYIGAPFLCDFGDNYTPRIVLLDDDKVLSIKVGGAQKRLIDMNWSDPDDRPTYANPGDIVKIRINLEMKDVAQWAEIRAEVEDWAHKQQFVVNTIQPIVAYDPGERSSTIKHRSKSDDEYVEGYAKRLGIDKDTLKAGKELMLD